jgi:heme-degrading monooxygenase HmoA
MGIGEGMTVLELAVVPVAEGAGSEYLRVMEGAMSYFTSHPGCRDIQVVQGVESPDTFTLIIEWDAVEAHMDFRETHEFAAYREAVGPLMASTPTFAHWRPALRQSGVAL